MKLNVCLMSSHEKLGSVLHQCVRFIALSTNVFLSNQFDWQASLGKVFSIGSERLITSPAIVTAVAHSLTFTYEHFGSITTFPSMLLDRVWELKMSEREREKLI